MLRVLLGAVLATLAFAQEQSFPLEAIRVEGTALGREMVVEIAQLKLGQPVNNAVLEAAATRLRESGVFQSILYSYAPGPKRGYILTLTLEDDRAPVAASIDIPGVDSEAEWKWLLSKYPAFDHRVPGNDAGQRFVAAKIEEHALDKLRGQHIVARLEEERLPVRHMLVSFQPEMLPAVLEMRFPGAKEFTDAELSAIMKPVLPQRGYTERSFRVAVELNLRRAYEERGLYRVSFGAIATQTVTSMALNLTLSIDEGARYKLGEVQLQGEGLPVESMLKEANFAKGATANWTAIQNGVWTLEKLARRAGYYEANANPVRDFDDAARVLNVRVGFRLGPLYRFGNVSVIGLPPNLEEKALAMWGKKPGEPYDFLYSRDFFQKFFRAANIPPYKKYSEKPERRAKEPVMDVILIFEPR